MRFVIYDEYLEPITVVDLPGMTSDVIESHGRVWRMPVREPISLATFDESEVVTLQETKNVTLTFEQFARRGVVVWMVFTKQDEWAMLLDSALLPGQRRDHADLRAVNAALSDALIKGMFRGMQR